MTRFAPPMRSLALCLLTITIVISASAQTYTELVSFNGNSAAGPKTPLTQGIDGSLYGTTRYGGTGTCFDSYGVGCGVVFKITNGKMRVIYSFQQTGPYYPGNDLVLGSDFNFYGTSVGGVGAIFKVARDGSFTTLHTFTGGSDGADPLGGVIQATDGNFYGTTAYGGAPSTFCPYGCGTVFKMTPEGVLTTLYSFCPQNYCPDGTSPTGPLVQGIDGNFYGTTSTGGLYKEGTFFKIKPNGSFQLLYTFNPYAPVPGDGLILATDGNFYGTTQYFFRITPAGVFTQLQFPGYGANLPIQGSDGNLYATTQFGGSYGIGSIFEMPTDGTTQTTLYNFAGYPNDGSYPQSRLMQATDGTFYGTTYSGGSSPCNYFSAGCGTVFSYNAGLGPFVALIRRIGRVGQRFLVLGQGLTGTTSVSLNGTPASFTVKLDTSLVAMVPTGATSGYVTVTTPSGTLTSNTLFYVLP
jgi:uncharacterized repeat protein (TIGR03803 family)